MASLTVNDDVQEHPTYTFYKKYCWTQIAADHAASGRILRTIYRQFGNWCVEKGYSIGDESLTKVFWFRQIVPYLCYEDPCVLVRGRIGTKYGVHYVKINDTTILSSKSSHSRPIASSHTVLFSRIITVWNLSDSTSRELHETPCNTDAIEALIVMNENTVVSLEDPDIRIWNLSAGTSRVLSDGVVLGGSGDEYDEVLVKLNDMMFASFGCIRIRVWNLSNDTCRELTNDVGGLVKLGVKRINETTFLTFAEDDPIRVWDVRSFENRALPRHHAAGHPRSPEATAVAVLNDTTIASGNGSNGLRIWDLTTGASRVLGEGQSYIVGESFKEWVIPWVDSLVKVDETKVVSIDGKNLILWDVATEMIRVLSGHTLEVQMVVTINETTIVSGSLDSTIRVWDLTNKTSRVLNGHTDAVYRILKLNKSMIVSSSGKTWRLWDLTKNFNPEDVENLDDNVVGRLRD